MGSLVNHQSAISQNALLSVKLSQEFFQQNCANLLASLDRGEPIEPGLDETVDRATLEVAVRMRAVIANQPALASEAKPSIAEQHRKRACAIAMAGMWCDYPALIRSTLKKYFVHVVVRISGNVPSHAGISV